MVLTIGVEPITSSLPWNCSAIGAMQAERPNIGIEDYKTRYHKIQLRSNNRTKKPDKKVLEKGGLKKKLLPKNTQRSMNK